VLCGGDVACNSIEEKTEAELNALKSKENILTNDSQQEP